ncbi:MAG: hypothetical protein F4056_05150 [Chloroflexi bacterium]|nr:hypothetical protein [Chloroflexota bacterium]
MATEPDFGTLSAKDPRTFWPDEAKNFTPWLQKHISVLEKALGLKVEITEREKPVGNLAVDLYGREERSGRTLIIENQLGDSDPDHLGRLLIYTAGLEASIVIWVARRIRDEHRKAIELLNSQTPEEVGFFGVELEVLQIDQSRASPRFNVVVRPRDFQSSGGEGWSQWKADLLDPKKHEWEWIREGYDPVGVKSVTNWTLKEFHVIRDKATGNELMVGRGEMIKYAGVTPPKKPQAI